MKEKITKLIDVKSIMTIVLTLVFAYLSVIQVISAEQFLTIFTVVISFYFQKQITSKQTDASKNTEVK